MTQTIIQDLYKYRFKLCDRKAEVSPERRALYKKLDADDRHFREFLSADDFKRFRRHGELYNEISALSDDETFAFGFVVGARVMLAVCEDADTP